MSSYIKRVLIKFIFLFCIFFIIGYFVKWLNLNIIRALIISFSIEIIDLIEDIIKISKKKKTC